MGCISIGSDDFSLGGTPLQESVSSISITRSDDGGETWLPNSRITDYPTNPNKAFPRGAFIGDYNDIKAVADDVYMLSLIHI